MESLMDKYSLSNTSFNGTLNETLLRALLEDHFLDHKDKDESVALGLVILYVPTFLAGFVGNSLLAIVILARRRFRNVTNFLLCNLAMADLSVTIICIPVAVGQALYRIWLYGEFMCKMTGFLQGVTVAASVFTIALLSIDRYLAIRHPMLFRRLSTNAVAIKLILIVWLLSIALMVPLIIVREISVMDIIPTEPVYFCGEHWTDDAQRQHYDLALFAIVYIIPGCIICTCYGLIGSELFNENKDLKRTESATSQVMAKQMMKGRKRVAKMLIALAVLFAICWLPYYCVSLYLDFYPEQTQLLVALPYTIFLGHSNSALNPILYFYSSKSFRCVLLRMFKCRRRRFKPARQENMIVRCTRNNPNTTTALTRRPFVRMLSNTKPASRFSRSSNNSLKSTSGSNRTSFKSTTSTRTSNRNNDFFNHQRNYKDMFRKELINDQIHEKKSPVIRHCHEVLINQPTFQNQTSDTDKPYHKKSFMEATISIPTTINEESSRMNSIVPMSKLTPAPSMEAINEESSSTTNTQHDKNKIEMLTFAIISNTKSGDDSSLTAVKDLTDQDNAQICFETPAGINVTICTE
ncbi:QRFP-like peptide receptor isoform X1 [Ruditapes philippinarum]|uniref:QRFP-like peptide receptor isoform X1 n=1 Tax=Ruditapes philippinarum TaxID=129788 RepID=UPI00295B0DC6|nr:QRFP-like peptide receptor isoform X1 [Ruditapes philippinarum]